LSSHRATLIQHWLGAGIPSCLSPIQLEMVHSSCFLGHDCRMGRFISTGRTPQARASTVWMFFVFSSFFCCNRQAAHCAQEVALPDEISLLCDQHECSAAGARTTSNYCASGVALCDPGLIWQGPMTKWNSGERLYFKYWRRDCHCYSLRVVDYWSLKQPFKVAENLSQLEFRHPASKVHSLSASVQKCLAWADVLPYVEKLRF